LGLLLAKKEKKKKLKKKREETKAKNLRRVGKKNLIRRELTDLEQ
jgi:hypothetical protein